MADNENKKDASTTAGGGKSSNDYVLELKRKLAKTTEEAKKKAEQKTKEDEKKENTVRTTTVTASERQENIAQDNRSYKKVNKTKAGGESSAKGVLKKLGIIAVSVVLVLALVVGGYVVYLESTYSRIEDMKYLQAQNNQSSRVVTATEYSITTFNIGFGAYSQGYSFFMDENKMKDGTKTKGESSRALSEEEVKNNTSGAISLVSGSNLSDFYFFQEVDTESSRSYYINQADMITKNFSSYGSVFASNFHTGQLFYPLNEPIGKVNSGILTLSKYCMDYSVRRSLPVSGGFIDKFFDLDRCFTVTKLPVYNSSKNLVLVNVHLSAYDEGDIRTEQLKFLYDYMDYEYNKNGNYVIVGGDFNHSLAGDQSVFQNKMEIPAWLKNLPDAYNGDQFAKIGYKINCDLSSTIGTCRDSSTYYTEGVNLEVILDGFITSANVQVVKTTTIDGDFKNSDHNPVRMTFKLA